MNDLQKRSAGGAAIEGLPDAVIAVAAGRAPESGAVSPQCGRHRAHLPIVLAQKSSMFSNLERGRAAMRPKKTRRPVEAGGFCECPGPKSSASQHANTTGRPNPRNAEPGRANSDDGDLRAHEPQYKRR
jgi:hypothetical protein